MGCSESKIKNVETVNRCKQRKEFMKQSVSAHNAFAAAHFAYAAVLKNIGAVLSDYAQGELHLHSTTNIPPQHLHPPYDSLPLPPPPHPDSSNFKPHYEIEDHGVKHRSSYRSSTGPRRSARWQSECNLDGPTRPLRENDGVLLWDFFFTLMEEVPGASWAKDDGGGEVRTGGGYGEAVEESEEEVPPSSMKRDVQKSKLLQVFRELDGCFMKASESAIEVSKILEANRLHYHSNFAHNSGNIDHSRRFMRVITWNKSFKRPPIANDLKDYLTSKENETHATVLNKLLAWEKKLYDEVKAFEEMKYVYQKKKDSLNILTKQGDGRELLERTEATVSHLHARCMVQKHLLDSTVSEINRLRDKQLYPKLLQLIQQMGIMWENMRKQHEKQSKILQALRAINISQSLKDTSDHNLDNTHRLRVHVKIWHSEFQKLMLHQKDYIKSLNNWLKFNLISIDNNSIDKTSSPKKPQNPKIQLLLRTWEEQLEKLPEEGAKTAINTFGAAIETLIQCQSEEMKMKNRCEETRREMTRKSRKFEQWCDKHIAKRTPAEEMDADVADDKEVIAKKQMVVEALKRRLEEETEAYRRQCAQAKDKSLMNLKSGFPEVFTAMSEFCRVSSLMYGNL